MKPAVFLSYAIEDQEVAARLRQRLELAGVTCWVAPWSIEAGRDFPTEIVRAIEDAKILVLLLSRFSNESRHVQQEVRVAFDTGTLIVPIQIEPVQLSDELKLYVMTAHRLESTREVPGSDLDRLVSAVKGGLEEAKLAPAARLVRSLRRHRGVLLAAGVLLVLAASYRAIDARLRRWTNPIDGQQYAWVPGGELVLGCSAGDGECDADEEPATHRTIARGFWLATTEVTTEQWNAHARGAGLEQVDGEGDLPVVGVTRDEAIGYCRAVGARLPSEAEWEYAARAGSAGARYGSLPEIAWYEANSDAQVHQGGGKRPNALGLYDTLGNVWEWASDRYFDRYDAEGADDPGNAGAAADIPPNGSGVVRGGSSISDASTVRVSNRFGLPPDLAGVVDPLIGFRCARDAT